MTTMNTLTMSDESPLKESRRTQEDTNTEWLNQSDTFEDVGAGYEFGENTFRGLPKPSQDNSTEYSRCKRFKLRDTLLRRRRPIANF